MEGSKCCFLCGLELTFPSVSQWQEIMLDFPLGSAILWLMFSLSTDATIHWWHLWFIANRICLFFYMNTIFSRVNKLAILNCIILKFLWKWQNSPQLNFISIQSKFMILLAMIYPMILALCPWETIPVVSFVHSSIESLSAFNSLNAVIYSVFAVWRAKIIINDWFQSLLYPYIELHPISTRRW